MNQEITQSLATFIATHILKQPGRQIAPTEALISNGLIDSFNLVDLALFVEDNFGVSVDDTELNADTFDSLEQLTTLILKRQS